MGPLALAFIVLAQLVSEPVVTPPVSPKTLDKDLRELPRSQPWKPGDPVREVPDLKRSAVRVTHGSQALEISGSQFSILNASGEVAAGPIAFESLWPEGSACRAPREQTIEVRYDESAKRWLLSRWAQPAPHSSFRFCVALSRTADPVSGGWFLYDFALPMYFADSALEVATNSYFLAIDLGGSRVVFAFDRNRMLEGRPASFTTTKGGQS